MKPLLMLSLLFLCTWGYAQRDTTISNDFSKDIEVVPLLLQSGDIVRIKTESPVFLMNKMRYEFCQSLAKGDCEDHYMALLNNFKESIAERDKLMKSMVTMFDSSHAYSNRMLEMYKSNLAESRMTLAGTQKALDSASENLKEMQKTIKEVRQENFMKKFWVGAGCTGAGIIIGLLLVYY